MPLTFEEVADAFSAWERARQQLQNVEATVKAALAEKQDVASLQPLWAEVDMHRERVAQLLDTAIALQLAHSRQPKREAEQQPQRSR